jgi:N-acyl homoserine lactone hydrolase
MEAIMRIHAIQTGRVPIKQGQIEGRGHGLWRRFQPLLPGEWVENVPVYAFAIEHPEGVIVVDTGSGAHLKQSPPWHPFFRLGVRFEIEPEQEIGPLLRSLGIGPRDVKTVVLTHLHCDHDGGLAHFPHSRIFADSGEIARAAGIAGAIRGYLPYRWPDWFDPQPYPWQQLRCGPFGRSARMTQAGDVVAVPTPGHTPDHVSILVDDGNQQIILAGDVSYLEEAMLSGTIDGVSPDESAAKTTLADIRALCAARATTYLPTHDPRSAERLAARRTAAAGPCGERLSTAS